MYGAVYDAELTIDQVLTALAGQPKEIVALTADLARTRLHDPPSRGACSDMWGNYIATILAEDRPTIRAMNSTTWIKSAEGRLVTYCDGDGAPESHAKGQ